MRALRTPPDGYVRAGTATANFGFANDLEIKRAANGDADGDREGYLMFDLSRMSRVTNARLRLFGHLQAPLPPGVNVNIGTAVLPLSNMAWKEGVLTWANRPRTISSNPLATIIVHSLISRWYEVDVTTHIRAEKTAGRNVTCLILRNIAQGPSGDLFTQFNSRQAGSNGPQLVITR